MFENSRSESVNSALLIVSDAEDDTVRIGKSIGYALRTGDTVLLSGDLGAGKTRMVHGMAEAIESPIPARSPTFVIVNEYPGTIQLSHCDLYRLGSIEEVEELAFLNSLIAYRGQNAEMTAGLRHWVSEQDLSTPTMLVTHSVNIGALIGSYPREGEIIIARRTESGDLIVVGSIQP